MVSAEFEKIYQKTGVLSKSGNLADDKVVPSNDEQLDLYAYAKIAKGEDVATAKKPGMLDFVGKAKHKKWQEVADTGIKPNEAEAKYIEIGKAIIAKYGTPAFAAS